MSPRWLALGYASALTLPALTVVFAGYNGSFVLLVCGFAGLAGLMMLAVQFVTSGRFERFSAPLGLDAMMGFHRFAGRAVAIAILLHVILAVWLGAGEKWAALLGAADRLFTSEQMVTGIVALAGVLAIIWAATRRERLGLRYEWWRASHGIAALVVLVLSAQHAWSNGVFIRSPGAAALAGSAIVAAVACFAVVYVMRAWHSIRADWVVVKVCPIGGRLHEVTLTKSAPVPFSFQAGQFVWVTFDRRHPVTDHPFSIASSPGELPRLRFIIKEYGDFTSRIGRLPAGTPAYLDGPHGNFTADLSADAIVLIAGGVGIAPVLSILRSLAENEYAGPVRLLIATRTDAQQLFGAEVEQFAAKLNLKVTPIVEQPTSDWRGATGRIGKDKLADLVSGLPLSRADILICGPLPMMAAASAMLLELGAPAGRIHYERFDYHDGSDLKSRTMRRAFLFMLVSVAAVLVLTAAAAVYLF